MKRVRKKMLKEVTVTKLISAADIGRNIFHLYYKDVYDLYDQLLN